MESAIKFSRGTGLIDNLIFVLCFIKRGENLLMLHRNKPPNKGKWNCVGGHIEPGEAPIAACIREVWEETGFTIDGPTFHGLLTWEGFEIPMGGLYLFSADVPVDAVTRGNGEGILAWKPKDWVITSDEVVDNLHIVTPLVLVGMAPQVYHFVYRDGVMQSHAISEVPDWVRVD